MRSQRNVRPCEHHTPAVKRTMHNTHCARALTLGPCARRTCASALSRSVAKKARLRVAPRTQRLPARRHAGIARTATRCAEDTRACECTSRPRGANSPPVTGSDDENRSSAFAPRANARRRRAWWTRARIRATTPRSEIQTTRSPPSRRTRRMRRTRRAAARTRRAAQILLLPHAQLDSPPSTLCRCEGQFSQL